MTQKKKGIRASLATSYSRTLNRVFGRGGPPDLFGGSISKEPSSSEGVDGNPGLRANRTHVDSVHQGNVDRRLAEKLVRRVFNPSRYCPGIFEG